MHQSEYVMLIVVEKKSVYLNFLYHLWKRTISNLCLSVISQIVQYIQHRGVFDVPEVGGGESSDNTEDSDSFQQEAIIDIVPINVEDNIIEYCMGDVETEVVPEGGTSRDINQNEEHDIPDVDLDMDYDMYSYNNCLKCYVLVLKFYACFKVLCLSTLQLLLRCFVLILNLIWILMWSFVVLS